MRVRVWKLLALFFIVVFALSVANSVHAAGVIGTIIVGRQPYAAVYDIGKGEIFVTNYFDLTVSVISDSNNKVIATIPRLFKPMGIAYDSGKGEVFVTNGFGDPVSVISDSTNTVVANVSVGQPTFNVAYDSNKSEIFVTTQDGGVSVISDSSNSVVATIPVGHSLEDSSSGIAFDSAKGEIFVTNAVDNTVSVIADSNNTVILTIPVGIEPNWVAYDSGKGEIFVTNRGSNTISVISDSTNTVVTTIPVGNTPDGVAYDSGKDEIFVANSRDNTTSVISDNTNTVIETVPTGEAPQSGTYDSGKGEVFITNYYSYIGWGVTAHISETVQVILDSPALSAPSVTAFPITLSRGQTSNLVSTTVKTGIPPYIYQWFSEAPGEASYTLINGAISPSYNFTTTASTATGNWSFMLEVTDWYGGGATVNSTATTVVVNAPFPAESPSASPTVPELSWLAILPLLFSVLVVAVILRHRKTTKLS